MNPALDTAVVSSVAHLIQLSVAPVFLLAAIAGLLNVFVGRLARIIDKIDKLQIYEDAQQRKDDKYTMSTKMLERRSFLQKRLKTTNYAIALVTSKSANQPLVILVPVEPKSPVNCKFDLS